MKKKEKNFNLFVSLVRLVGALWLGFLVSFVPLYIFRGIYHDVATKTTYENIIISVISILTAMPTLFLMYRGDDEAARMERRDAIKVSVMSAYVHVLLCTLICWTKYPLILLGGAFPLASLVAPGAHDITEQAFWSWIVAALITAPFLIVSVYGGCLAARRKREKASSQLLKK